MTPFSVFQARNRLNGTEVKRGGTRMGKERMVESQDAEMSDRVANLESPAPLQPEKQVESTWLTDRWKDLKESPLT